MTSTAQSTRYFVVVTARCRAVVEVEATSKAEARAKARRLQVAQDGRGFTDGWTPIYTPLHVEAGAATPVDE